jgi:hypothetical protein
MAVILILIGLPIVLATAFVQEGLPARDPWQRGVLEPSARILIADFESRGANTIFVDAFQLAHAHERLGDLYEQRKRSRRCARARAL